MIGDVPSSLSFTAYHRKKNHTFWGWPFSHHPPYLHEAIGTFDDGSVLDLFVMLHYKLPYLERIAFTSWIAADRSRLDEILLNQFMDGHMTNLPAGRFGFRQNSVIVPLEASNSIRLGDNNEQLPYSFR